MILFYLIDGLNPHKFMNIVSLAYIGSPLLACVILAASIVNSDDLVGSSSSTNSGAHVECLANGSWTQPGYKGSFEKRHEAGFVRLGDLFYLIGGRGVDAVGIYNPETGRWSSDEAPPFQVNHFQPVVVDGEIWIAGGMTGSYPSEEGLERILIYNAESDAWRDGPTIPESRRRGSCGAVYHEGYLYMVSGIVNGHISGWVKWLDRYDVANDTWTKLADAPTARDHFHSVISDGKIWNVAGRQSGRSGVFGYTIDTVDYYDLENATWGTLPASGNIPTPRAGNMAINYGGLVLAIGGESVSQNDAHSEVEALNPWTGEWSAFDDMVTGRHGSGVLSYGGSLYLASGSGERGGDPELLTIEKYTLPVGQDCDGDGTLDAEEIALYNSLDVIGSTLSEEPKMMMTSGGVELSGLVPGLSYDVQESEDLVTWSLSDSFIATSESRSWSPPLVSVNPPASLFYRLRYDP